MNIYNKICDAWKTSAILPPHVLAVGPGQTRGSRARAASSALFSAPSSVVLTPLRNRTPPARRRPPPRSPSLTDPDQPTDCQRQLGGGGGRKLEKGGWLDPPGVVSERGGGGGSDPLLLYRTFSGAEHRKLMGGKGLIIAYSCTFLKSRPENTKKLSSQARNAEKLARDVPETFWFRQV